LGNLYAKRDWGYAPDYCEAMWKILQQKKPDDYVIATGKTYSVKEFINFTCKYLNMNIRWKGFGTSECAINRFNNKIIIKIDKDYFRPVEVDYLLGDAKKARKVLKWNPKTSIQKLVQIMVDEELNSSK
jgi:GDPmannose 4,6-dehydratase